MIIPSNYGTISRCSLNLYNALREAKDCEVKVVMVHKYRTGFEEFENCEFFMEGEGSFIRSLLQSIGRTRWIKRIKKDFKPNLTISMLPGCSTLNVKGKGNDCKIGIFHAPNTQIQGLKLQYMVSQFSYRYVYPKLDKLFCVNKGVYEFFLENYPWIEKTKMEVVYNVHPINKIKKLALESIENNEELQLFKEKKVILFCGRLEFIKAPLRLLTAFRQSILPSQGYHLVFIGQERQVLWNELKESAASMGIDQFVHYIGAQNNPYKYMARSAALVSSSKSEGLPGVLIESLILGKPVVTTNSSRGVWEILSCDEHYDANLQEEFRTTDGIITPNTHDEQLNVEQLALALNEIVDEQYNDVKAPFLKKVTSKYIIDKYLNCIK